MGRIWRASTPRQHPSCECHRFATEESQWWHLYGKKRGHKLYTKWMQGKLPNAHHPNCTRRKRRI